MRDNRAAPSTELTFVGTRPIRFAPEDHIVLSVVRNEALRLPYLLAYYRRLGFDAFIFVDNGSTDGTREFLLAQPDTFVFHTEDRFGAHSGAGLPWKNALLDRFCDRHWVMVADADELLVWPGCEAEHIHAFTARLDAAGAEILFTLMLDMYSDRPFGQIGYRAGEPFTDYAPYFDSGPYLTKLAGDFPFRQILGGVRARMFKTVGHFGFHPPTVSKVPLVRWRAGQRFVRAQHGLVDPAPVAAMQGALLHFKMFDDLPGKCADDARRREYFDGGREDAVIGAAIQATGHASPFSPSVSVRYTGSSQLVALGLMTPLGAHS